MHFKVMFVPKRSAVNAYVALVQVVSCMEGPALGKMEYSFYGEGMGPEMGMETADHWHVDAKGDKDKTPAFAVSCPEKGWAAHPKRWLAAAKSAVAIPRNKHSWGVIGSTEPLKPAIMMDQPGRQTLPTGDRAFEHRFEVVAITGGSAKESENGIRLGSLSWGYSYGIRDPSSNKRSLGFFPLCARNAPTPQWIAACLKWNGLVGRIHVPGVNKNEMSGQAIHLDTKSDSKSDTKAFARPDIQFVGQPMSFMQAAPTFTAAAGSASAAADSGSAAAGSGDNKADSKNG